MQLTKCVLSLAAALALSAVPSVGAADVAAQAQAPRLSAEAKAYMDYRKEVPKAKRLEDLYYYFDAKSTDFYRSRSAEERSKILEQLKSQVTLFPEFTVAKEEREIGVTKVIFNAKSADNKEALVTVDVIREGPQLKIGQANWSTPQ